MSHGRPIGGSRRLVSDERWDSINQPTRGTRDAEFRCSTCGARGERDATGHKPQGYHMRAEFDDFTRKPHGWYCCDDCALVAFHALYGSSEADVRDWLASLAPVTTS